MLTEDAIREKSKGTEELVEKRETSDAIDYIGNKRKREYNNC